jgi:hypothetical protein
MYRSIKYNGRATEYRHVIIREVNTTTQVIIGETSQGDKLELSFSFHPPVTAIPIPGEIWTIRRDSADWRLDEKIDNKTLLYPISALLPGDRRLETSGDIYIQGKTVTINGELWDDIMTKLTELETRIAALEL